MSEHDVRDQIISFLQWELVGPGESEEVLEETPTRRYSAGVLFPGGNLTDEHEDVEAHEAEHITAVVGDVHQEPADEEQPAERGPSRRSRGYDGPDDEPVHLANASSPAAMGLSFLVDSGVQYLRFDVHAGVYIDAPGQRKTWKRQPLQIQPIDIDLKTPDDRPQNLCLAGDLRLYVLARKRSDGSFLVTASIYNAKKYFGDRRKAIAKDCYFQAGFEVRSRDGRPVFREYRLFDVLEQMDEEQRSLELLYRMRKAYAVGHGCAADWDAEDNSLAVALRTAVVPVVDLPPVLPRESDAPAYDMHTLAGGDGEQSDAEILEALGSVAEAYCAWIEEKRSELDSVQAGLLPTAEKHLARCQESANRISQGVDSLRNHPDLMLAFRWANRAMLMQQAHFARPRRQPQDGAWSEFPQSYRPDDAKQGRWRCFQLAFILMTIPAIVSDGTAGEHDPRNIVDLIWFPTGGGKTEAYLGLAACAMLYRRLRDPMSDGCTVLTRYTLRLLTSQQFQRAASMICACEILRREHPQQLGTEPISIGLWLGGSTTPNQRSSSKAKLGEWMRERGENPFQLLSCPWCGTALDNRQYPGYRQRTASSPMQFVCPEKRCAFSKGQSCLPVSVVDEDIYESPPTMIVATVDKFAMLAWNSKSGAILGLGAKKRDAPDLIIQDELHLIAGPLGSMVGLYESVIELMCRRGDRRSKIVASTATIRGAHEQCRNLYDRRTQVFPAPGIDSSDNYFAVERPGQPARRYVGVFGSAAPSQTTAALRSASAMLQSVQGLDLSDERRDPYWTLVWYFNSIRELGQASTLVEADIPEYLRVIARRLPHLPQDRQRKVGRPVELTSRVAADEIPQTLQRLGQRHSAEHAAIDVLLATNMISVGVDVPRLGLMLVAGQPKTTAEYIQASSRVGRSSSAPGLVITQYSPAKPRDRSHYEHFRAYHESFYRFVEPTSVTPFSIPAMDRALSALLVIAVRHLDALVSPEDFSRDRGAFEQLLSWLRERCRSIDNAHEERLKTMLNDLANEWMQSEPEEWGRAYGTPTDDKISLMYPMGSVLPDSNLALWPTPTSLRNVDVECQGRVLSTYAGNQAQGPSSEETQADEHA